MLYNTVDSIVVGNFVGTEALAVVGSTTMIVNLFVFFFNGFSTRASDVIGNLFGRGDKDKLHNCDRDSHGNDVHPVCCVHRNQCRRRSSHVALHGHA